MNIWVIMLTENLIVFCCIDKRQETISSFDPKTNEFLHETEEFYVFHSFRSFFPYND